MCGSCYAFPTVDSVEGIHSIVNGELIELSPKEIIDCANVGGCNGGSPQDSFKYIANNGGLTTEKNYPYKPVVETCTLQKAKDIAVEIHGYQDVPRDETDEHLLKAVAHQPVAVSTSWGDNLALYKEGIVQGPCDTTVLHSTLAVGYGTDPDGTKYWILKNSWGEEWGDKGYYKLHRGIPDKKGMCGIAQFAAYPVIEADSGIHASPGAVVKSIKDKVLKTIKEL
ncbi:unnamed protein product [Lactuca saligna]|uniref:Peptidase C1A papain C-terminal domain-containing protein n=1 Tax=Lactuca saligna TaxID=75948 RepID=A0AA35YLV5_LACSI|nr:unnamed protein product [Lactuca saligna]